MGRRARGTSSYLINALHRSPARRSRQIQALSRAFKIPIHVIQSGPPVVVSHGGTDDSFGGGLTPEQSAAQGDHVVRISYHKRMYGLGEVSGEICLWWRDDKGGAVGADGSITTLCARRLRDLAEEWSGREDQLVCYLD